MAPSQAFLEVVTVSVGFDDFLDVTLARNHSFFDTYVVVTTPDDTLTQLVAKKYEAECVVTERFYVNGHSFNKGAALNDGFARFRHEGWRACMDADIALPDNFRRVLFEHTDLDENCLYGIDRVDVVGKAALDGIFARGAQYGSSCLVGPNCDAPTGVRFVDPCQGYVPVGFFQLWHASQHRSYSELSGTAAQDDVVFGGGWPRRRRQLIPTAFCYHLQAQAPVLGENWAGTRQQPRLT
jgi:hypothetical protein